MRNLIKKEIEKVVGKGNFDVFFREYKTEVNVSIKKVLKKIKTEQIKRKYIPLNVYPLAKIQHEIKNIIQKTFKISGLTIEELKLELPPPHIVGDIAISTFFLAERLRENSQILAEKIAKIVNNKKGLKMIESATAAGSFVNFKTKTNKLYDEILTNVNFLGEQYGESDINSRKIALIDYSAPNIAKPIGVGHLRSTIIGQALANIYWATGYSEIRDNHLGDWGTQFGVLIYAYEKWGKEQKIIQNPLEELKNLYVKFHQEAEKEPELKERARDLFKRLELKDPKMMTYWKRFRDLSIVGFKKIYNKLGIEFDTYIGESYFTDQTDPIIENCLKKGICRNETDTKVVIVDSIEGLPSFLLQKQDGSTLYLTRDLATLKFRVNIFKPDIILYVVGEEQKLHFQQLFALAKKMGYFLKQDVKHIDFGMILNKGRKMSTRKGTVIELEDLISKSIFKSKQIILQKNPDLKEKEIEEISEIIGIGAILYNDLCRSRIKNISFDWEKMLDFEGGSATYLQYTHTRIQSILRKTKEIFSKKSEMKIGSKRNILFEDDSEFSLAKKIMFFPFIVISAQKNDSPHFICTYLEELSKLFNNFYDKVSIIGTEDQNLRKSRILLIKSVALVIKIGLGLLNIKVPLKM